MRSGPAFAGLSFFAVVLGLPAAADLPRPAELPPPDFAGQQYVDSRGCLFLRAGPKDNENWIPRVTRDGAALCDNPPSGRRVPVLEDGEGPDAATPVPAP